MGVQAGGPTYEVVEGWGELPEGWALKQVAGVAVDSQDRVYVFNRGTHPVVVFDRDGHVLTSWGDESFKNAHGITIGPDGSLYFVDNHTQTLKRFSPDGELLLVVGTEDTPIEGGPFSGCTDVALAPSGEIYVSDGYGNRLVHKFSPEGELLLSWGEEGTGPGQFALPHSVWVDTDERVLVADRENDRIQIFSPDGDYITEWTDFAMPTDIYIDGDGLVYVSELKSRVSILNREGKLLARWGGEANRASGQFVSPHAVWTDSHRDLYVGEVLEGQRIQKFHRMD